MINTAIDAHDKQEINSYRYTKITIEIVNWSENALGLQKYN